MALRVDAGRVYAALATAPDQRREGVGSTRGTLARAALIFVPLAAVGVVVLYLLYLAQSETIWSVARTSSERAVALGREVLSAGLATPAADALYLSDNGTLRRWIESGDPAMRDELAGEFLSFMSRKSGFYNRVRFIDAQGREVVRIDAGEDAPFIVADAQLRDLRDRSYVSETLRLDLGQVHVSPVELIVENDEVRQPATPIVRLGTPVFSPGGEKVGLIVVNYLVQRLFNRVRSFGNESLGQTWLLNAQGYWLVGPTPEDEFGFMYEERRGRSFAQAFPDAWQKLVDGPDAGHFESRDGLLNFAKVSSFGAGALADLAAPAPSTGAGLAAPTDTPWIAVGRIASDALDELLAPARQRLLVGAVLLLLLFALVAWLAAQHWSQRRAADRATRDSAEQFRSLIESAPDAVIVIDETGIIRVANAQVQHMFGYRRDELLGNRVEMLVPERYRERHIGHLQGYVAAPKTRPMGAGLELSGRRKDGSEFPVSISLSPIRAAGKSMIFCDIRDTSDQVESERQIRELNQRLTRDNTSLETINRELEAFSYSVSHDLRAPLRAIDGFSQALQEDFGDSLDEMSRGHLNRVRLAAQRMGMLIDDLLKLARVSRAELAVSQVDLSGIARNVVDALAEAEPERVVQASVEPGLVVRGDARLLGVALENLLGNAWKFTAGRAPAKIAFGRTGDGAGGAAYYVSDNGAGFDMAYAGKLFGAFQRLHDAADFPGTGIGLATVQRIIHRHGGKIWAEAEPGVGATFRFTVQEGNF